jgi:tRNA threonylcarbamoyladenosine biosynthesis protein TsaB
MRGFIFWILYICKKSKKVALILNIETATKNCSVSIADKGEILVLKELNDLNYSHAEKLHPFINSALKEAEVDINQIDAVAVSKGPGSYTGLRIGVSAAKGICFAIDKPLISIETLTSLSTSISVDEGVIVPMLDARRMEVYVAVFSADNKAAREIKAEIIDAHSFSDYLEKGNVYFLGDGAPKCQPILTHKNAIFVADKFPSAKEMATLSFEKFQQHQFEDVAYFEPFYLKDFLVVPEKKKTPTF